MNPLVIIPFAAFIGVLVSQAITVTTSVTPWVQTHLSSEDQIVALIQKLPYGDRLLPYRDEVLARTAEAVQAVGSFVVSRLSDVTRGTLSFIFNVVLMVYAMFFFLSDGARMLASITRHLPLSRADTDRVVGRVRLSGAGDARQHGGDRCDPGNPGRARVRRGGYSGRGVLGYAHDDSRDDSRHRSDAGLAAGLHLSVRGGQDPAGDRAGGLLCGHRGLGGQPAPSPAGRQGDGCIELLVLLSTLGGSRCSERSVHRGPIIAALFITLWDIQGPPRVAGRRTRRLTVSASKGNHSMNFIKTVLAVLVAQIRSGWPAARLWIFTALVSTKQPVHVADGSWLVVDVFGEDRAVRPPASRSWAQSSAKTARP
jgi:hypothetical protein